MLRVVFFLLISFLAAVFSAQGADSIVGSWQFKNQEMEIVAELSADGTFRQVNVSAKGRETSSGRYQLTGQMLYFLPQGASQPLQLLCRFLDADTLQVTYPSGETLQWKRLKGAAPPQKPLKAPEPQPDAVAKAPGGPPASPSSAGKRPPLFMQRTWEPNEKAFSFLMPRGWKFQGGIFNVNPLTQNGPGNSIGPKCDLNVKRDDQGTVLFRWAPTWNYADLTYSPTGFSLFKPGQYYQGMLVKVLPPPKQFLTELFQTSRPQAANVTVIAEDPMREVVEACYRSGQQLNQQLQQMGIKPYRYEALAMLVEYSEGGQRFREVLKTVITDARGGAFMWSNDHTVQYRAPASEFEAWKPALDVIQSSIEVNPQWLAAVTKAMDQRGKMALETQRYINKVSNEILENRRRTHAEIRYENYLFLSGQDEYVNPFSGKVELDTSAYRYRWMDNHGDILFTDENSYDPNKLEQRPNREWKLTPIRPR